MQLFDFLFFLFGLRIFYKTTLSIIKKSFNVYSVFVFVFFIFQFPSLILDHFFYDQIIAFEDSPNLYKALLDERVSVLYDIVICVIIYWLYKQSKTYNSMAFNNLTNRFKKINFGMILSAFLYIGMLSPIICVLLAPDPSIYSKWAYLYRYNMSLIDSLYFENIIENANIISFLCMIIYAFQRNKNSYLIYFNTIIITWISFKRTLLFFALISFVFVDYIKGLFVFNPRRTMIKYVSLTIICVLYFIYYGINTRKGDDVPFYYSYTLYYSRHYCLKVAILDQLNGMTMLDYRGQSFVFDLLFFIPRSIWENKPSVFTQYLTNYCKDRDPESDVSISVYYANIWSEYFANFHVFGIFFAFIFIKLFIRVSEKSNNPNTYLVSILFIIFYFFWGIQPFTMLIIVIWWVCYLHGLLFCKKRLLVGSKL